MHTHKLKSGIVVLHIHPYPIDTEQSNSSHKSEKEMLTFDMIFYHSYCIPSIVILEKPIVKLLASLSNEPLKLYPQVERQLSLSLRGPPYSSFT